MTKKKTKKRTKKVVPPNTEDRADMAVGNLQVRIEGKNKAPKLLSYRKNTR